MGRVGYSFYKYGPGTGTTLLAYPQKTTFDSSADSAWKKSVNDYDDNDEYAVARGDADQRGTWFCKTHVLYQWQDCVNHATKVWDVRKPRVGCCDEVGHPFRFRVYEEYDTCTWCYLPIISKQSLIRQSFCRNNWSSTPHRQKVSCLFHLYSYNPDLWPITLKTFRQCLYSYDEHLWQVLLKYLHAK